MQHSILSPSSSYDLVVTDVLCLGCTHTLSLPSIFDIISRISVTIRLVSVDETGSTMYWHSKTSPPPRRSNLLCLENFCLVAGGTLGKGRSPTAKLNYKEE